MSKKMNCEIRLYDVLHCGLYETTEKGHRSTKSGAKHVLPFPDLIRDLKHFAFDQGLKLAQTSTYSKSADLMPAYCADFQQGNDSYLLALWNEVPAGEAGIQSLDGAMASKSGNIAVHTHKIAGTSIPGFMTYFWLLPKKDKIAAVILWSDKRPSTPIGTLQLNHYIKSFIENKCCHLVDYTDNNGNKCTGFSDQPRPTSGKDNRVPNARLKPFWATQYAKSQADLNRLRASCDSITSVMRNIKLMDVEAETNGELLNAFKTIFKIPPKELLKTKKFRIQGPVDGLSNAEINNFIYEYETNGHHDDYNMGFKLPKDPSPIWLSGCFEKYSDTVIVNMRANDGYPDVHSLLGSLKLKFKMI
ncbi:hypothetical protein [Marinomonas profundimaris]|uniref:Uncharacterized protein n=1 Tax=Marinomonas profundimaris TaxID=1208321 RepID=W1S1A0_9GAMM|nr:hypothetical protein [Marinomonas profundimaris]ETI60858.1 hypothetical protein D104_09020 [Marinomonas profundimaris]